MGVVRNIRHADRLADVFCLCYCRYMRKATTKKTATIETSYGSFLCFFEPEKDMGGFTAEARGVQGAVSWGKTFGEAKRMIREAIEGAIEAGIVANADRQGIFRVRNDRHALPAV